MEGELANLRDFDGPLNGFAPVSTHTKPSARRCSTSSLRPKGRHEIWPIVSPATKLGWRNWANGGHTWAAKPKRAKES